MLIEAAYPKRLGTPRRRTIETGETSAPADSMTSPSLVVRSARTLQCLGGHKRRRCVWCSTMRFGRSEFNRSRRDCVADLVAAGKLAIKQ